LGFPAFLQIFFYFVKEAAMPYMIVKKEGKFDVHKQNADKTPV